jgi:hypothetical protein
VLPLYEKHKKKKRNASKREPNPTKKIRKDRTKKKRDAVHSWGAP